MWKDRQCTGCNQGCEYDKTSLQGTITYREAQGIRFKESKAAARRGEYGRRVRRTRARVLGLMHETKRDIWLELITQCPERIYPPPGEDGPLDFDSKNPDEAAEVAAAQAVAMQTPISRAELEAQLTEVFPSDRDEWEQLLANEYRAEMAYRKKNGIPRPVPQPDPVSELAPWDEGFTGGVW